MPEIAKPASKPIRIVETFVSVVQRRPLKIEARLLPALEPLFLIQTHMSFEERIRLFQVALTLPEQFVACEIGSYLGASSCFLAAAATFRGGYLHCVDTWQNEAMGLELPEDTFARFCENTYQYRHFLSAHRGVAANLMAQIPDNLDLVFVDGDHSYEAVMSDLTNYVPKIKPGGVLALHDYNFETVRNACADFMRVRPLEDKGCVHTLQMFQVNS